MDQYYIETTGSVFMVEESWDLKMEAVFSCETLASTRKGGGHIPEDKQLLSCRSRFEHCKPTSFRIRAVGVDVRRRAKASQFMIELF
jgi:hypothetical protein